TCQGTTTELQLQTIMNQAMAIWSRAALKSVFVPGGIILLFSALLIRSPWLPISASGLRFFYYAVFIAALALSLRFRSLRIVFGSLVLLLAHYALVEKGTYLHVGRGHMAFEVIGLLVPLDFILLTLLPERTLTRDHLIGVAAVLFFESTFVAVFARPDQPDWALLHLSLVRNYHLRLTQPAL